MSERNSEISISLVECWVWNQVFLVSSQDNNPHTKNYAPFKCKLWDSCSQFRCSSKWSFPFLNKILELLFRNVSCRTRSYPFLYNVVSWGSWEMLFYPVTVIVKDRAFPHSPSRQFRTTEAIPWIFSWKEVTRMCFLMEKNEAIVPTSHIFWSILSSFLIPTVS